MHHAANMPFALRGKAETLDPFFYRERLYLRERYARPVWFNVILDPRLVAAASCAPLGNCLAKIAVDDRTESYLFGWPWIVD